MQQLPTYTIFWYGGETQLVSGTTIQNALQRHKISQKQALSMEFFIEGDARDEMVWDAELELWHKSDKALVH